MPAVTLECPGEAPSTGPVPLRVTMTADMRTYYDNNGILDQALEVILVRRDRPGVRFLAKIDPHVWLVEAPSLSRPSDAEIAKSVGSIREEHTCDLLDYGATHEGSADYYALATFAAAIDGPKPLRVTHASRRLPSERIARAPALAARTAASLPPPLVKSGVVAQASPRAGDVFIEGRLRAPILNEPVSGLEVPPFVTVVAARLDAQGGASAGAFTIPAEDVGRDGGDHVAGFAIPFSRLAPTPGPGRYWIFVFAAEERTGPIDAELPRKETSPAG